MAGMKPKAFKKSYTTTLKSVPQGAVWSGRGIGIPVAGAVDGSGDGSKDLGRPRRPLYKDDGGSPSQSADSTWASYMARVNKDWDEVITKPMFPEQDDSDEDIYKRIEDSENLTWYDLGKKDIKGAMKKETKGYFNPLDEDAFVHGSKYSLSSVDNLLERSALYDTAVSPWLDIAGDVGRQVVGAAVPGAAVMFLVMNVAQLNSAIGNSDDAIREFYAEAESSNAGKSNNLTAARKELENAFDDILTQFIDVIQAGLEALPDYGVGNAASFLGTMKNLIGAVKGVSGGTKLTKFYGLHGGSIILKSILSNTTLRWSLTALLKFLDSDFVPGNLKPHADKILSLFGGATGRMIELGDLMECYDTQKKNNPGLLGAEFEKFKFNVKDCKMNIKESNNIDILRQFIRESTRDTESYHNAQPLGYEYRRPPETEEDEEGFEIQDEYDDSLVAYRADGGVVDYQARPSNVEESAVRSLIRKIIAEQSATESCDRHAPAYESKISTIMGDYDYEEDDDLPEQDEVGGFMQPLGYGSATDRKKRRDSTIRAVAGAFGGADY